MIIDLVVGTTTDSEHVSIGSNTTLRQALESRGIDLSVGVTHLNGKATKDVDKTFDELHCSEKVRLIQVVKGDGGLK